MFADAQADGNETKNDSMSGYEIVEQTNPYSDYQSINEYDMMSDVHSNIMHDSSNSDIIQSIYKVALKDMGTSNSEQPPYAGQESSNTERLSVIVASQTVSPDSTKPVYRKTPVPSRKWGQNSRNVFSLLPNLQQDEANSPNLTTRTVTV